jgi:peptide chain release factor 1
VLDVPGEIRIEISGADLTQLQNEPGGHRLQRIPPTERKGRVHTSTVTVAVLDTAKRETNFQKTSKDDFEVEWFSGSGAGGQHRNKTQNCARITHLPTGIVESAQCRSRDQSYKEAMTQLLKRLQHADKHITASAQSVERKRQMGSGERGDKIRTYRFQDDIATDHRSGKKVNLSKVLQGHFDLLWC